MFISIASISYGESAVLMRHESKTLKLFPFCYFSQIYKNLYLQRACGNTRARYNTSSRHILWQYYPKRPTNKRLQSELLVIRGSPVTEIAIVARRSRCNLIRRRRRWAIHVILSILKILAPLLTVMLKSGSGRRRVITIGVGRRLMLMRRHLTFECRRSCERTLDRDARSWVVVPRRRLRTSHESVSCSGGHIRAGNCRSSSRCHFVLRTRGRTLLQLRR